MNSKNITRKDFLKSIGLISLATVSAGVLLSSCGGKSDTKEMSANDKCNDLSGLSDSEKTMRDSYGYITKSTDPDKSCKNCNFYHPPVNEGDCATCQMLKGPVMEDAYCKVWIQKVS